LLLQSRVGLHLGNLSLCLLHLSLGQPHLRRCKIRVLFAFALLRQRLRGLLYEVVNESIELAAITERRKRELDHATCKLGSALARCKQGLDSSARIGKSSQELCPALLLRHLVCHDGGVCLNLDGECPRLLV